VSIFSRSNSASRDFVSRWPSIAGRGRASYTVRHGIGGAAFILAWIWLGNWALGWDLYPWSGRMPRQVLLLQIAFTVVATGALALWEWRRQARRYEKETGRHV